MSRDACVALARRLGLEVDEVIEAWAERAAVREFEGGQPHDEAEREAFVEIEPLFAGAAGLGARRGPRSAAPAPAAAAATKRTSES